MNAPIPHAAVIALVGGRWPLAVRMAMPCAFCTVSTVIASGMTSSTSAIQENCGAYRFGAAKANSVPCAGLNVPASAMTSAPAASAAMSGGTARPRRGTRLKASQTTHMESAIAISSRKACTSPIPKRRKTPATIAITIGIGTACIARRTQPERPSRSMTTPVAR